MTRKTPLRPAGGLPEETIPIGRKRERGWEKENRPYIYRIPAPLYSLARQAREDVNSIAHYDETGQPRNDQTTADQIAGILVDVALQKVALQPGLINASANPRGRGKMTVYAKDWGAWQKPAPIQQLPKVGKKKLSRPRMIIGYRWPAETDQAVRGLSRSLDIPIGETVLRLLQIGIEAYKRHDFRIVVEVRATVRAIGWESPR
jgi:hypothetical protein